MIDAWVELAAPVRCVCCGASGAALCPGCAGKLRSAEVPSTIPGVDRLIAAWNYDGPARALILALKVGGLQAAAIPLVEAMRRAVVANGLAAAILTWVPGRRRDTRRRGFDHAEVLARGVAARLGLPVARLLERSGASRHQTELRAEQRWDNLQGAFVARACRVPVAVVDDLVTTGATASSCALTLRRAGAPRVELLASCRAQPPRSG